MFDLHVTKWSVYPDVDESTFVERAARTGVEGVELLGWRSANIEELLEACETHGINWVSTGAGGAAGNGGDADTPAMTDPTCHDAAVEAIEETCQTVGEYVDNLVITVGPDQPKLDRTVQHRTIVSVLRDAAPAAAAASVSLAVEPLNTRVDHPGYYLTETGHAVEIVDAVDHPNVGVLFDIYHQQITEGDLIARIREFSENIAMFHLADVPGRHEPGTGEINWTNVFAAIAETGWDGTVGLEYVPGAEPDETVQHVVELREKGCQ